MKGEELFRERTPEAAARQLATVLAWLTECELATLERLRSIKSAGKAETARHQSICDIAVRHCRELGVTPLGLEGRSCPRLAELLATMTAGNASGKPQIDPGRAQGSEASGSVQAASKDS